MGELKSSGDITNSLLKALNAENGLDLKALTARLSSSEQEALETNLIRGVIEKFTKDGITDFSKVSDTLKNAPFESKRAVEIMGELNKKAPILNNTSSLLEKLTAINPKAKELQQGIGHSVTGALMTMKRNLAIERLKSLLPVLGNDASLKNHIRNAINNAGDLKSVINNLEKIEIKDVAENSTKLLEAFKNEVKALREEAQTGEIKGDNFITKESPAPKSDLNVKISVDDWVRELSEINNNELSANLFILQNKHPELFKKPSDVYRLLKEIKNNPTHFFKNNRPDIALIAKVLEDGSVGKLGIVKESGLVGHLSKSTNKNEMDRLKKVNEKELKVGTPYPTLQRADVNQVGPTAGAKSTFSSSDESIIPKQTQELDKTLENINVKPYKNKEDALVKEGYLNPTWEPQLKTIAKEHALDEAKLKEIFLDQTINTSKGRKPNFFLDLGDIVPTYGKSKRSPEYTNNLREIDNKLQQAYEAFVKPLSASESKKIKTLYANPHIASGLLGGTANGADENGNVSPEEFAKGFIYALFGSKFSASAVKRISPELYNSILGLGKKMPQMAKDNPKLLTKIYGSAKSNSINSFAGEKALNASANKLSKAKAMLEKGEDEVKIWQSTGWYKDKDGAWKFEIDDSPAKIKNQNADKLGDLLEHKELFKAYPELKDIKIKKIIDEKVGKLGYYDPNEKEIALRDLSDKSTLMHEVQHAIQDVEGFAKGGGQAEARSFLRGKEGRKYEQELKGIDKTLSNLLLETQHMRMRYGEIPQSEREYEYAKELFRGINNKEKVYADFSVLRDDLQKKLFEIDKKIRLQDIQDTYKKIHGEAEARNVETRLNLDGKAYPHETFDVNPNDTFVSREDGVNFSKKLPELKEKRGIYNVTYNGKFSTPVYKDLTTIDDAIKYAKGDKSKGAKHISIRHLNDENKEGYVTRQELLSLGENIRAYLKENKEPFIDKRGGHIYEWEDKDGVRFRAVIGQAKRESDDRSITSTLKPTDEATKSGIIPNSSLYSSNDIITFYSDRNLKEPMKFENPKLKLLDAIDTSSDKVSLVKKVLLNKDISDGVKAKAVNRLTKNKISQGAKTSYISTKNSKNN